MKSYDEKKQALITQLKKTSGRLSLKKKTSNLFGDRVKHNRIGLDLTPFNNVISVDTKKRVAEVEGLTTYETLVKETLKHGLLPAVAPELKSITVGGVYAGVGVESSTFRYGFMHETVEEADILTGNGVLTCNAKKNSDLFYTFPNTYGSLGYALRLRIKLVPAKPYVKIEREKFTDIDAYVQRLAELGKKNYPKGKLDFIEGLVFNDKEMYVMTGVFTDDPEWVSNYTNMRIYYKSVPEKTIDYLETEAYIFRYDTDWFWNSQYLGLENPLLRSLVPKKYLRSDVYYKIMRFERKHELLKPIKQLFGRPRSEQLSQDAEVLVKDAPEFLRFFLTKICNTIPLTIAPAMPHDPNKTYPMWPNKGQMRMNIGFYAPIPTTKPPGYYNKLFDKKVLSLKAFKMLYSDVTMTEKEFWSMFDKKAYDTVKKKYDPDNRFLGVYEKCT